MDPRLFRAAKAGNVHLLTQLLEEKQYLLLQVTPNKNTTLHIAARHGHKDFAQAACLQCPNLLRQQNLEGDTALHVVARAGHYDLMQFLVNCIKESSIPQSMEVGRTVSVRNVGYNTPLHYAAQNGHVRVVELLMIEDPTLLCSINLADESPLYLAAEQGHLEVVIRMLQVPPTDRAKAAVYGGPKDQTALHISIIKRHFGVTRKLVEVVPQLIKRGDGTGRTALHYAAAFGDLQTVRLLLNSDTSAAYCSDNDGRCSIHIAASSGHVNIMKELLKHCPDCYEVQDRKGRNALHAAVENNKVNTARYILRAHEFEEILNMPDHDGNTALHLASINSNYEIMCLLAEDKKVNVEIINKKKLTILDVVSSIDVEEYSAILWKKAVLQILKERHQIVDREIMIGSGEIRKDTFRSDIKNVTDSTLVVAALIATVTFAAIFTMPGGYINEGPDIGKANRRNDRLFIYFLLADALAMLCSATAAVILIFRHMARPHWIQFTIRLTSKLVLVAFVGMSGAFSAAMALMAPGAIPSFFLILNLLIGFCWITYSFLLKRDKGRMRLQMSLGLWNLN